MLSIPKMYIFATTEYSKIYYNIGLVYFLLRVQKSRKGRLDFGLMTDLYVVCPGPWECRYEYSVHEKRLERMRYENGNWTLR